MQRRNFLKQGLAATAGVGLSSIFGHSQKQAGLIASFSHMGTGRAQTCDSGYR